MLSPFELKLDDRARSRLGAAERVLAYAITLGLVLVTLLWARKSWQTNDDIGMAMISQGYGIAGEPSAGVVFSNVAWGWLLTKMPTVAGIESYTSLSYAALLVSMAAILLALHKRGSPASLSCGLVVLMFVTALLMPQFTLTAGYLAVAGLAVLLAWHDEPSLLPLIVAGILLLAAGLIRSLELCFVLVVSAPLLAPGWKRAWRWWLALAAVLAVALGAAHLADLRYYAAPEWAAFRAMQPIRVAFTDYGLYRYLQGHPPAPGATPLSSNDLALIANWFYADPRVFNPGNFTGLVTSVPLAGRIAANFHAAGGFVGMWGNIHLTGALVVLILLVLLMRQRVALALLSFCLLAGVATTLELLGRGEVTRVYIPAAAALPILYLLHRTREPKAEMRFLGLVALLVFTAFGVQKAYPRVVVSDTPVNAFEKHLCALPQDALWVVWGNASFPYQFLYRPGLHPHPECEMRFYSLGSMQLAPYELEVVRQRIGAPDLVSGLLQGRKVYLFSEPGRRDALVAYFAEHYHKALAFETLEDHDHLSIYALHVAGPAAASDAGSTPMPSEQDDGDSGGG